MVNRKVQQHLIQKKNFLLVIDHDIMVRGIQNFTMQILSFFLLYLPIQQLNQSTYFE